MLATEITTCRSCGSERLESVLNLGELMISDFIQPGEAEEKAPLELVCCQECSLVQLRHTVDRDHLYRGQYWYRSATNESMVVALRDVVEDAMRRVKLYPDDKVLDIGANDGTLLAQYPTYVNCYGYEPATNLQDAARKNSRGCIYPDYFPSRRWWLPQKYKVITSIAQFYNVDDVNGYVAAVKECLDKDGVWIVQYQDLEHMLGCNGFDNICHEHTLYLGAEAFQRLLDRHDLKICGESHNSVNGGSVRWIIKHGTRQDRMAMSGELPYVLRTLKEFGQRVETRKVETLALLERLKTEGKTVYAMGASTKFNTLAQYYGLTPDLITAIGERSPEKWGKMTVGTHIPIVSEETVLTATPDFLLIGPWHFIESFRQRYTDFEANGGKWIVPLPQLCIVGGKECHPSFPDAPSGNALAASSCEIPS